MSRRSVEISLLLLLLFLVVWIPPIKSTRVRFLREETSAHEACQMADLVDACPDSSVDAASLKAECDGIHGLQAAKCYMEYLCTHHNQETVNTHKACIDEECPLAKHMPPLDCQKWEKEEADNEKAEESESNNDEQDAEENNNEEESNNNNDEKENNEETNEEDTNNSNNNNSDNNQDDTEEHQDDTEELDLSNVHAAHGSCHMDDLVDECPDSSVKSQALKDECHGIHGLQAAKCYMEYLCSHHDQSTVDHHKECIDTVCPLAKRVPTLLCDEWEQEMEQQQSSSEQENGNGNDKEEEQSNNNDNEDTTENDTDHQDQDDNPKKDGDAASTDVIPFGEQDEDGEDFHGQAEVDLEEQKDKLKAEAAATQDNSSGVMGGLGWAVMILVVVCVSFYGLLSFQRYRQTKQYDLGPQVPNLSPYAIRDFE